MKMTLTDLTTSIFPPKKAFARDPDNKINNNEIIDDVRNLNNNIE